MLKEFKLLMKCCASPTTSTAADANPPAAGRAIESTLQAMLFSSILKPLAAGLGPAADIAVESVVQHLFVPGRP
jgi:hypothetical protein